MPGKENNNNQSGMIVIEASLSLTIFIIVVAALVSIINIFVLTNKVQFSMNAAAHKTASYAYLYQVLGLRGGEQTLRTDFDNDAQSNMDTINQVTDSVTKTSDLVNQFESLMGSFSEEVGNAGQAIKDLDFGGVQDSYNNVKGAIDELGNNAEGGYNSYAKSISMVSDRFKNPGSTLGGFAYLLINTGTEWLKDIIGSAMANWLTKTSFDANGYTDVDEYLKAYGVKDGFDGLDFSKSSVFKDNNFSYIDFVVEYDVELGFAKILMFKPSMHIVQRVTVPAWLNGDGIEVIQKDGKITGVESTLLF